MALETCKLFAQVPAAGLKKLSAVAREMRFDPGAVIFKEGDPGDGLYVVRSGKVQRGQNLLLEAFGGGFTWASALLRY